jgi:hypothetical protein
MRPYEPPATTAPVVHLELWIFPQIFEKIQNGPKWDTLLRGLGETIHEKTWNQKSHGTVPLNFILHVQIEQQIESRIFSLSFLSNWKLYSMTVNLLKGPPPSPGVPRRPWLYVPWPWLFVLAVAICAWPWLFVLFEKKSLKNWF